MSWLKAADEQHEFLHWMKADGFRFVAQAPDMSIMVFATTDDYDIVQIQFHTPNAEQEAEFVELVKRELPTTR